MNTFKTFASGFLQYSTRLREGSTTSSNCLAGRTGRGSGYKALKSSRTGSPELIEYCGVQDSVCNLANVFHYFILTDTQLASERLFYRR